MQGIGNLEGDLQAAIQEGGDELSSKTTYFQWEYAGANVSLHERRYPFSNQTFPVLEYVIFLRRDARLFYMVTLWLPPIFLAILAISTFFMSPAVGERLSYGITILLASQFGKAVQQTLLPVCREVLWIDVYLLFHEIFYFVRSSISRSSSCRARPSTS